MANLKLFAKILLLFVHCLLKKNSFLKKKRNKFLDEINFFKETKISEPKISFEKIKANFEKSMLPPPPAKKAKL